MKVYVTTLTDHRIDKQLSTWFCEALTRLGIDYTISSQDMYSCDVCVMFNGVLTPEGQARIYTISGMMPVLYMYDDCDLCMPTNVTVVSQFTNTGDIWFPISKLACFSKYWDNPIKKTKKTSWFYGGTYKERRDYSELSKLNDLLICGDDERWDEFSYDRFPTIRDMDILYHLMSTCHNTIIVPDVMHDGINMPLRFYEGVFCDVNVKLGNTIWPPKNIKASVNVNEVLRQIKDILNGTKK